MSSSAQRTPPFVYVACDIPDGVTLTGWRCRHQDDVRRRPRLAGAVRRLGRLVR
jgi:hypothetical protein